MRRALLLTTLIALLVPAGASAAGRHVGPATKDATGDAAADLRAAHLEQDGHTLTAWVDFANAPRARICVWLTAAGKARPLCASRASGPWQLSIDGGAVLTPTKRRVGLQFPDTTLKLTPGKLRWRVTATASGCATKCVDRLPEAGTWINGRVYRAKHLGCVATGEGNIENGPRDRARVALTFDDGPWSTTPQVLDLLKANNAHATFFELGDLVHGSDAAFSRRIIAEGHEIGDHSWDHSDLHAGGDAATKQMKDTNAAILAATGYTPCLFRPPSGLTGRDLLERTRALGMSSILWDVSTKDFTMPGVDVITAHLRDDLQNGSIVVLHDGGGDRSQTIDALRTMLPELRAKYELVTVSDLLGYAQKYRLTTT